jgi:ACS family sodium-dependent inorganic phosphate cotransporter
MLPPDTPDTPHPPGWKVSLVRKLAQSFAFLAPTACLLLASSSEDTTITVAAITAALGLSSFSLAGLYCTHQDLSPKYSSALLGLTNTAGAVPGIVGVAVTGFLYDETQSWPLALFAPTMVFLVAGALAYGLAGSNDTIDFEEAERNRPFPWENLLQRSKQE